jgi:predicted dehydrogenase
VSSATPLRVGIVGANAERAWARDAHLPALKTLPQFRLEAVSARTQELAKRAADAFGAARAFGDSLELVRDPAIDIVAVTIRVPDHREIVLAALKAGKHIYCEWPLGRDEADAQEMAEAAARAPSSHVIIGLQALAAPAVRHAAKIAASGALGELQMLRVVSPTAGWGPEAPPFYAYLQDKRNGATLSTIAGGHTLAAMEAIAGAYSEVDARSSIVYKTVRITGTDQKVERSCPDHVLVLGRHASGCLSSLEVLGGQPRMHFRLDLIGSKGTLEVTAQHARGGFQVNNLECRTSVSADSAPAAVSPALEGPPANVAECYARLAQDIRDGSKTAPDFHLALRLTRLLDAIDTASAQGRRQKLGSTGRWSAAD